MKQSTFVSDADTSAREAAPEVIPPRWTLAASALAVGGVTNLLLRQPGDPGLNLFLAFVALALALGVVTHRAGARPGREAVGWVGVGLLLAGTHLVRDADPLQALALLGASAAFAMAALSPREGWLRGARVADPLEAVAGALVRAALGPLGWVRSAGAGWAVTRGGILALPLLLVFGGLLVSADPVFESHVDRVLGGAVLARVAGHAALTGVLAWAISGYMAAFPGGTRLRGWLAPRVPRPTLGIVEVALPLGALSLLFGAFVAVQFGHFFGGGSLVAETPGLTYAEYAREGFGQLLVAVLLVVPLLLFSDWVLRQDAPGSERIFRTLGTLLLGLLLLMLASAGQRVALYQSVYGWSEARFYGAALLVWLAPVSLWLGLTVLRGERRSFTAPALLSAFAALLLLVALNPGARIAQANLERPGEVDALHMTTLGADAVPALVRALPGLPVEVRCVVGPELARRWGGGLDGGTGSVPQAGGAPGSPDWLRWNLARARAHRMVAALPPALVSGSGCTPAASAATSPGTAASGPPGTGWSAHGSTGPGPGRAGAG
jgi:hypothetical protein